MTTNQPPIVSVLRSTVPANILIGHIDLLGVSMAKFGMGLCSNELICKAVMAASNQHHSDPDATEEDEQFHHLMQKSVASLKQHLLAFHDMLGGFRQLRDDLAKSNDVGPEPQYETAAYTAEMLSQEWNMGEANS